MQPRRAHSFLTFGAFWCFPFPPMPAWDAGSRLYAGQKILALGHPHGDVQKYFEGRWGRSAC